MLVLANDPFIRVRSVASEFVLLSQISWTKGLEFESSSATGGALGCDGNVAHHRRIAGVWRTDSVSHAVQFSQDGGAFLRKAVPSIVVCAAGQSVPGMPR